MSCSRRHQSITFACHVCMCLICCFDYVPLRCARWCALLLRCVLVPPYVADQSEYRSVVHAPNYSPKPITATPVGWCRIDSTPSRSIRRTQPLSLSKTRPPTSAFSSAFGLALLLHSRALASVATPCLRRLCVVYVRLTATLHDFNSRLPSSGAAAPTCV